MGRHADPRTSRRPALPVLIAAGVVVLLLAGGLVWWLADDACDDPQTVAVTVAPEVGALAENLLRAPIEYDGGCARAQVTAQEPLQTVGRIATTEDSGLPDVWVPDSSLWVARAGEGALESAGSMATSPVVLATSREAVEALGWAETAPGWGQALAGVQPLAVPDLA